MSAATDARRALLAELFDDAGLFPPASLPMDEALAGHGRHRRGPFSWMLGRFVCPVERVGELPPAGLRLTLLVGPGAPEAIAPAGHSVEQAETRLADEDVAAAVRRAARAAPDAFRFVEVPAGDADVVKAIAGHERTGAKIRCGGADAAAFPSADALAATLAACRDAGVRLKATAGLHHPVRALDAADGFVHHGFLNLLAAAAVAHARGLDAAALAEVLADEDPASFRLDAGGFAWRDLVLDPRECSAARSALLAGIGSCSFDEPVADLTAIGALPA